MAFEIEYYPEEQEGWSVWSGSEFLEKKIEFARIISDSLDEVGLAIDEIEEKWPAGPFNEQLTDFKGSCGGLELSPGPNGERVARQLFSGFLPTRVRGRWQVYWGRILW